MESSSNSDSDSGSSSDSSSDGGSSSDSEDLEEDEEEEEDQSAEESEDDESDSENEAHHKSKNKVQHLTPPSTVLFLQAVCDKWTNSQQLFNCTLINAENTHFRFASAFSVCGVFWFFCVHACLCIAALYREFTVGRLYFL